MKVRLYIVVGDHRVSFFSQNDRKASGSKASRNTLPGAVFHDDYESDVSCGFNFDIFQRMSEYCQHLVKSHIFYSFESFC